MKKKKILFVYYHLFKAGGVSKVMTNLANELVEDGYDVEILIMTSNTNTFYPLNEKIKVHHIDTFLHIGLGVFVSSIKSILTSQR